MRESIAKCFIFCSERKLRVFLAIIYGNGFAIKEVVPQEDFQSFVGYLNERKGS